MEISDVVFETMLERIKEIQLALRDLWAEMGKWRQNPVDTTAPTEGNGSQPPTEKQIHFLRGLGVQEIPASKVEARRLLQELNERLEEGEYSIPPTEKQLKYLKDLKYAGKMPESKEEAWELLKGLRGIE